MNDEYSNEQARYLVGQDTIIQNSRHDVKAAKNDADIAKIQGHLDDVRKGLRIPTRNLLHRAAIKDVTRQLRIAQEELDAKWNKLYGSISD